MKHFDSLHSGLTRAELSEKYKEIYFGVFNDVKDLHISCMWGKLNDNGELLNLYRLLHGKGKTDDKVTLNAITSMELKLDQIKRQLDRIEQSVKDYI